MADKNKLLAAVRRARKAAQDELKREKEKLAEAVEKDNVVNWLRWRPESYVYAKALVNQWGEIVTGIEKMIAEGEDGQAIGDRVRGQRDYLVELVMRREAANKSTSQMSNLIGDVQADVYRAVAGTSILDKHSLWNALYQGGINLRK